MCIYVLPLYNMHIYLYIYIYGAEGLDDREEGVRRQHGRLISVGVDDGVAAGGAGRLRRGGAYYYYYYYYYY